MTCETTTVLPDRGTNAMTGQASAPIQKGLTIQPRAHARIASPLPFSRRQFARRSQYIVRSVGIISPGTESDFAGMIDGAWQDCVSESGLYPYTSSPVPGRAIRRIAVLAGTAPAVSNSQTLVKRP